jgi:hypothetical protein
MLVEVERERIKGEALEVLRGNDMGRFIAPTTNGLYPAQWNWDSAYVALALTRMGDQRRAWQELESLLSAQWRGGMVPHIAFHADDSSYFPNSTVWQAGEAVPSSGITQPPVLATFVRLMLDVPGVELESRAILDVLFPRLFAYHKWYHEVRDPSDCGLVTIVHPWESGFDNNPVFDEALHRVPTEGVVYARRDTLHADASQRPQKADYDGYVALLLLFREKDYDQAWMARNSPFRVADVGVNALLLRADHDLRYLAGLTAHRDHVAAIDEWIAKGSAALERLWLPELGMFGGLDQVTGQAIALPSVTGLSPLFSMQLPPNRVAPMAANIQRWLERTSFGLPSFDPEHALFDPRRYCRGPSWFV